MIFNLSSIRERPYEFHKYYRLLKWFSLQNKYSAQAVLDVLEEITRNDPSIKKNQTFMDYCSYFRNQKGWEKELHKWLAHDLDEIAAFCSRHRIKLIIQNYPYPYQAANETLKQAAIKHGLVFVENQAVFDKLTQEEGHDKYFRDDDHCSAIGHEVIVDNIYRALVKNHLIASEARQASSARTPAVSASQTPHQE